MNDHINAPLSDEREALDAKIAERILGCTVQWRRHLDAELQDERRWPACDCGKHHAHAAREGGFYDHRLRRFSESLDDAWWLQDHVGLLDASHRIGREGDEYAVLDWEGMIIARHPEIAVAICLGVLSAEGKG